MSYTILIQAFHCGAAAASFGVVLWGCREASKSGLSSFGVGHVTVSVKDTGAEHHHRI